MSKALDALDRLREHIARLEGDNARLREESPDVQARIAAEHRSDELQAALSKATHYNYTLEDKVEVLELALEIAEEIPGRAYAYYKTRADAEIARRKEQEDG